MQKVKLVRIDPQEAIGLRIKHGLHDTQSGFWCDTGIWYDNFVLEFGEFQFEENKNEGILDSNSMVSKRKVYFKGSNDEYYQRCVNYFDDLKRKSSSDRIINMDYYENARSDISTERFSEKYIQEFYNIVGPENKLSKFDELILSLCETYSGNPYDFYIFDSAANFGKISSKLHEKGYNIVCNEPDIHLYKKIEENFKNSKLKYSNFAWLQLENEFGHRKRKFNIILSNYNRFPVGNNIDDIKHYLKNFKAILNPKGKLIMDFLNFENLNNPNKIESHVSFYYPEKIKLLYEFMNSQKIKIKFLMNEKDNISNFLEGNTVLILKKDVLMDIFKEVGFQVERQFVDNNEVYDLQKPSNQLTVHPNVITYVLSRK